MDRTGPFKYALYAAYVMDDAFVFHGCACNNRLFIYFYLMVKLLWLVVTITQRV